MNTTKKIALGLVGGAIAIAGPLGAVAAANATTPTPTPTSSAAPWPGGHGIGMGGSARGGGMNGAGYGATAVADYLAEQLGVPADGVAAALQQYHVDNPVTAPGRALSDTDLAARQKAEADYLATALKVDAAKVQAALESFQTDRQATMTGQVSERLATMVKAGTITQAQADAILAAHDAGQPMMLGGHGGSRWS
jgi:hypothetical protein